MRLVVGNVKVRAEDLSEDEERWLANFLTFDDGASKYRKRYYGGDGKTHLFNAWSKTFPSGLIPIVLKGGSEESQEIEVVDRRIAPAVPKVASDLSWLRDYQRDAVLAVHARPQGIIRAPTGSGKTEIAIGLVETLPCRWLLLVHRKNLAEQAAERYEARVGKRALRVYDLDAAARPTDGSDDHFIVATFQVIQAAQRLDRADPRRIRAESLLRVVEGVIVDECHVVPAATNKKLAEQLIAAYYRIGMSATPLDRTDKKSILAVAVLGPIVYSIAATRLIEAGVLAKPDVRSVEFRHVGCEEPKRPSDDERIDFDDEEDEEPIEDPPTWQEVYSERVVHNRERNDLVVQMTRASDKPCFVFVKEIDHGSILVDALRDAGIRCDFTWGKGTAASRKDDVRRLTSGELEALVCSVVLQEGVDVPTLRGVVVATGGKSAIATLQRLGRGTRISAGKRTFQVWDVLDRGQKWLEKHALARMRAYRREGYKVKKVSPDELRGQLTLDTG